ncbi:MAG: 50S ribosomal protein L3 [Coxiellaceae bacterium]|nr:50S ribosomal protein L3 [Coxiellaceae bacterium]|tara:strand:+ start:358 stop:1005 length:648 start_codon:yes stop_codon:yes gene_type:complete
MSLGLVGKKCGMTRVFTDDGSSLAVTVVQVEPNSITQIKTEKTDGYAAVQIAVGEKKQSRVNKSVAGHFAKANVSACSHIKEFRCTDEEMSQLAVGDISSLAMFKVGQSVDVSGVTRGKGFAGGVKRHNFSMQDATHGNSLSHRAIGSTGQCQTPGRVFKGKKMPGQMGNVKRTAVNLKVIRVDEEKNILLLHGAVPGSPDGYVVITRSNKCKGE